MAGFRMWLVSEPRAEPMTLAVTCWSIMPGPEPTPLRNGVKALLGAALWWGWACFEERAHSRWTGGVTQAWCGLISAECQRGRAWLAGPGLLELGLRQR